MHAEYDTVWYGLWALGFIFPYSYKGDISQNITMIGITVDDYQLIWPEWNGMMWT